MDVAMIFWIKSCGVSKRAYAVSNALVCVCVCVCVCICICMCMCVCFDHL